MLSGWRVVRAAAGEFTSPAELSGRWDDAPEMECVAPVATIDDADDPDRFDWWHRATIQADEPVSIDFNGVTFPATVFVDGRAIAEAESMFLPVRVHVPEGDHEICVCFGSLDAWTRIRRPRGRWRSSLVGVPGLRWARTTLLGRAPVYGSVPAPVGFWRPIVVTPARSTTRMSISADPATGTVTIDGSVGAVGTVGCDHVIVTLHDPDGDPVIEQRCAMVDYRFGFTATVDSPALWWPNGYGPQNLYRASIRAGGAVLAERTVGFRSISVETSNQNFALSVNGVAVFSRGVTWAPPDCVRLHIPGDTMRENLQIFARNGANMVRIVGGLVYEQPEFWEWCARLGIMVWQDAMIATFDPPSEQSELIARELADHLAGISGNPALAVVSGGSETLQRPEMLGIASAERGISLIQEDLPEVVARHAQVPYVPSTPSPPASDDQVLAIRPDSGTAHWFGVGGYLKPLSDVHVAGVKFAAECLAFANPPSPAAVERHFGSAAVAGHDPVWKAAVPRDRNASWDFEDVRDFYVREIFHVDPMTVRRADPDRYLQLGRLAIAEAMRYCFAHWRRDDSGCSGALVLSGRDTAPGPGWGLVDVDGGEKVAMTVLRRVWAPIALVVSDAGLSGVRIDVYNETPRTLDCDVSITATNVAGQRVIEASRAVSVPARGAATLHDTDVSGVFRDLSNAFGFGVAPVDGVEVVVRCADVELELRDAVIVNPRPGQVDAGLVAVATRDCGDDWTLTISSAVALRYVSIDAPGWIPTDNHFHLPAAIPYVVRLHGGGENAAPSGTVSSIDSVAVASIDVPT